MTQGLGRRALALGGVLLASSVAVATGQQPAKPGRPPQAPAARPQPHGDHGTPDGWKFTWPKGDAAKGRKVFTKLECYSCHEVKGEKFRAPSDKGKVGPELSMMGPLHEAEYFAEAIINPSAVIEKGKGYQAIDGTSLRALALPDIKVTENAGAPGAGEGGAHEKESRPRNGGEGSRLRDGRSFWPGERGQRRPRRDDLLVLQ